MARALLLGVLLFHVLFRLSESHCRELENGKDCEVVRPVRLHAVSKREAEHLRPDMIKYAMTVGGKDIEMHLEKNNQLLSKDYTETFYQEDDTRVTTLPDDIDHCYYHGQIVNDSTSSVSVSTCEGLRGYFRTSAQRYLIEPLSADDEGDHAVTTFDDHAFTPAVCGVTNTSWSDDFEPPTSRSRSRSAVNSIVQQQKYIELVIIADNREYVKMNSDLKELRRRIFEVVNFVNMAYKPLRTFVALVGLEVWSNQDLISVTSPAGASLEAFRNWRNSDLVKRKNHDNAHLISGIDFDGATVGLAFIGTLCSAHSVGVIQDHNSRAIAVGATLAHEMGHNLGMDHDDSSACTCSGDSCIMAAALSWNIPRTFSSCSSSHYEKYLTGRSPSCLLDKPQYMTLVAPAVCGNGFLEQGEECDCGTVEECTNPCCNATACTLTEGSRCAAGECCHNCQISPRSTECRKQQDTCDLSEYCDGKSAACPEDVFAVNGLPCDGGRGYCYNGQCPQRSDQCAKLFGASAADARQGCYSHNTKGNNFGFCKRLSNTQFIPCQQVDLLCGKLFCTGGNDNPNYGRGLVIGDCKASFSDDFTKDYSQVDVGTKCGDGKVCRQSECMDLETAYKNTNCSTNCPGNAVCNHRNQCQCEPGWTPPNCDSKDEAFSSLSPGAAIAIALTVILLVAGAVLGVLGFMCRKPRRSALPFSAQTPRKPLDGISQPIPPVQAPRLRPPPPPPPAANRPKPGVNPKPVGQSYIAARQALRPVPPPKV